MTKDGPRRLNGSRAFDQPSEPGEPRPGAVPISSEQRALAELSAKCVDAGLSVGRINDAGKEELQIWAQAEAGAIRIGVAWFNGTQWYTHSGALVVETAYTRQALEAVQAMLRTS